MVAFSGAPILCFKECFSIFLPQTELVQLAEKAYSKAIFTIVTVSLFSLFLLFMMYLLIRFMSQ